MKNTCPFYIVFQVLKMRLIKICKKEPPDLLFLVAFIISFYCSRYRFSQFLELHSVFSIKMFFVTNVFSAYSLKLPTSLTVKIR